MSEERFRLRICYTKLGRLRYLSHLEVMRCMERCIRRAGVPFAVSQGFSPHMKHSFGWALPVGVGSLAEYMDIWLTSFVDPVVAFASLKASTPKDLQIVDVYYVNPKEPALEVSFPHAIYEIILRSNDCEGRSCKAIAESALQELLLIGHVVVVKKKQEKVVKFEGLLAETPTVVEGISPDDFEHFELMQAQSTYAKISGSKGYEKNSEKIGPTQEESATEGLFATMIFHTFTAGQGSLRPDIFANAMVELSGGKLEVVAITRTRQYGEPAKH